MVTAQPDHVSELWEQIRAWPSSQRLTLASRILQSLEAEQCGSAAPRKSLADLVGLLATVQPPPSDEE